MAEIVDFSAGDVTAKLEDNGDVTVSDGTGSATFDASAGSLTLTDGTGTLTLDGGGSVTISDGTNSATLSAAGGAQGTQRVITHRVNYDDSNGATVIYTVPTGKMAVVEWAYIEVETNFDGGNGDTDIDVGRSGDTDGYIDGSAHSAAINTNGGKVGVDAAERGAKLYDAGNGTPALDQIVSTNTISVTYTADTAADGTQGTATVLVALREIDGIA